MEFLYLLEKIRNPILTALFQVITYLGEETVFLVVALLLFWCIDKKKGYYLMVSGFLATLAGQFLKLFCKVDRPWVRDPNFTIVESAREAATGYSFPSGHTLITTATFGSIARFTKKNWLRILSLAAVLLVGLSRMYLGVHTPADVGFGWLFGAVTVLALYPIMQKATENAKWMWGVIAALVLLSLGNLIYVTWEANSADWATLTESQSHNLDEALKNAWTLFGLTVGLIFAYLMDSKVTHFETDAVWWAQLIKIAGGVTILLLVKTLLKQPLLTLTNGHHLADGIRYFIIVVLGGGIWPMTFRYFKKLK